MRKHSQHCATNSSSIIITCRAATSWSTSTCLSDFSRSTPCCPCPCQSATTPMRGRKLKSSVALLYGTMMMKPHTALTRHTISIWVGIKSLGRDLELCRIWVQLCVISHWLLILNYTVINLKCYQLSYMYCMFSEKTRMFNFSGFCALVFLTCSHTVNEKTASGRFVISNNRNSTALLSQFSTV